MSNKIKWKKISAGTFRMGNGKIIKHNQVFSASPEEVPVAFRDVVVPLEELPPSPEEEPLTPVSCLEIRQHKSRKTGEDVKYWYDVVNTATEKPINEKALRKGDAEKLLKEVS